VPAGGAGAFGSDAFREPVLTNIPAEPAMPAQELRHRVRNNLQLVHGMLTGSLRHESGSEEYAPAKAIIRRVMAQAEIGLTCNVEERLVDLDTMTAPASLSRRAASARCRPDPAIDAADKRHRGPELPGRHAVDAALPVARADRDGGRF